MEMEQICEGIKSRKRRHQHTFRFSEPVEASGAQAEAYIFP